MLGVRLPLALLLLLRGQNGGFVADGHGAFPIGEPTSWSADHMPVDVLVGIGGEGEGSARRRCWTRRTWCGSRGLPLAIVLLSGDSHAWIGLDCQGVRLGR